MSETTKRRARKPEYQRGYEDAVRQLLLLLTIGVDSYPQRISEATLRNVGPEHIDDLYRQVADALDNLYARAQREWKRKRPEAIA